MKRANLQSLRCRFREAAKRKYEGQIPISATRVATVVGLNRYENNRDLFLEQCGPKRSIKEQSGGNCKTACQLGLENESLAIEKFLERHQLLKTSGFVPPYIKAQCEYESLSLGTTQKKVIGKVIIGGKGDFIYYDSMNKDFRLLEIKCLVTRKITQQVPIHYYLQVQTMLYIFDLVQIPVKSAVYCENVFNDKRELLESWECPITLNKEYYQSKILPILGDYAAHLKRVRSGTEKQSSCGPRKRDRSPANLPLFMPKRRRVMSSEVDRVNLAGLFGHFLQQNKVFGPNCFTNFLNGNRLRDLYYMMKLSSGQKGSTRDTLLVPRSKTLSTEKIQQAFEDQVKIEQVVNICQEITPFDSQVSCSADLSLHPIRNFMPIRCWQTLHHLQRKCQLVLSGQLYFPPENIWVYFDALIYNRSFTTPRSSPGQYTPVICIDTQFNSSNKTSRRARFLLYLQLKTLKFYFPEQELKGFVVDIKNKTTEIDFEKENKQVVASFQKGLEWLESATESTIEEQKTTSLEKESSSLESDSDSDASTSESDSDSDASTSESDSDSESSTSESASDSEQDSSSQSNEVQNRKRMLDLISELGVRPNCKVKTRDHHYEKWKSDLVTSTGELTQLWSISNQKRDKLVNSHLKIDSVDKLTEKIRNKTVKKILGPQYPNLRNMLQANRSGKLVKLMAVRRELRSLHSQQEIFLDFEFTPDFLYMIGYYHKNGQEVNFCQHVLDHPNSESHQALLKEFADSIRRISQNSSEMINCYHWGEVEERLIKKYVPEIFDQLNFIDVHSILLDLHFAIPNCNGYSIKQVARALKSLGYISTEWHESTDGYWCNQTLSKLLKAQEEKETASDQQPSDTPVRLSDHNAFQKIVQYNQTDCRVLFEIVQFLSGRKGAVLK